MTTRSDLPKPADVETALQGEDATMRVMARTLDSARR
jgi:hypothetical protein